MPGTRSSRSGTPPPPAGWPTGGGEPPGDPVPVAPVRAGEARAADDPVLRDAAAELPDDALLADLRPVAGVAEVLFDLPVSCRYARRHGGTVLTAVHGDGEEAVP